MKPEPDLAQYPIRAVARMTGISIDTLRAWERRYEAVVPGRSDRGRLYTDADVARLKRLGELVRHGHAIGTIAGMPDAALATLLAREMAHGAGPPTAPAIADVAALVSALTAYDLEALESGLNRYAAVLPPRELVFSVILPLLQDVGRRWEAGELRPAQEHLVSSIVRSVLGGLLRASNRPHGRPKVVFATPQGERHELGLLCAALLVATAGHGVIYLGADLPAADIAHATAMARAPIVLLSLTTPGAVSRNEVANLVKALPDAEIWVGGPEWARLQTAAPGRIRHVEDLAAVTDLLARHAG